MSPFDLLDRVSSGHITTESSPERAPADEINNSLDGPGNNTTTNNNNAYPTQPIPGSSNLPNQQPSQPTTTTIPNNNNNTNNNTNYPPPPPPQLPPFQASPPAYRLTPLTHHPTPFPTSPPTFSNTLKQRFLPALLYWLRLTYLDLLTALLLLALAFLILQLWTHDSVFRATERRFPMFWNAESGTWYGPTELSWPYKSFVAGVELTAVLVPAVGVAVVGAMQGFVRSGWDACAGFLGMGKGFAVMTFLQLFLKQWIGEFRPFFITACNPVLPPPNMADPFPFRRYVTVDSCQPPPPPPGYPNPKHPLVFAMQSFPSGHTSEAFFMATFLALYLNAKLKAFSDYHTGLWKWLAVTLPLLGACLMAGTLVVDRNHHMHDILLSIPLGVLVALLAYRSHYASLFDYRTNHLPLPWSASRRSLHPETPAPGTTKGDNLAAVTWPRKAARQGFESGARRRHRRAGVGGLGLDGAVVERRVRAPGDISRGRLRQAMFPPRTTPLMRRLIRRNRSGPGPIPTVVVPGGGQGDLEFEDLEDGGVAVMGEDQGDFEVGEVEDEDDSDGDGATLRAGFTGADEPSTARATGHQLDLEGQRQRRSWTVGGGEEMD